VNVAGVAAPTGTVDRKVAAAKRTAALAMNTRFRIFEPLFRCESGTGRPHSLRRPRRCQRPIDGSTIPDKVIVFCNTRFISPK
jgi:hypothetical protein